MFSWGLHLCIVHVNLPSIFFHSPKIIVHLVDWSVSVLVGHLVLFFYEARACQGY